MGSTLWELIGTLPGEIVAGVALAMAISIVAARLLRLIPQDEASRAIYRHLRVGIILMAALLTFAVLAAVVGLYFMGGFRRAPAAPI